MAGFEDTFAWTTASPESLGFFFTIGDRRFLAHLPIRARGGLSWWSGRPFCVIGGLEIALLEFLNPMQARMVGLYVDLDAILRLDGDGASVAARPSGKLLIPTNAAGGIALGIGFDTEIGISLSLDFLSGGYIVSSGVSK